MNEIAHINLTFRLHKSGRTYNFEDDQPERALQHADKIVFLGIAESGW